MADIRAFFKDLLPKPDWSSITGTIFNQGESTERRAMDVVLRGNDGSIMGLKYNIVTSDLLASDLDANAYTFNPTVDAVEVLNKGVTDLTVTIQSMDFVIVPDEVRVLSLPAKIGLVTFSTGAVFRMNGLNRG